MSEIYSRKATNTAPNAVAVLLCIVMVGVSDAGISRNGISAGRISQFASIFVNGREFDIADAEITVDGEPATEADLKLGQTVFVDGTLDDELPVGVGEEIIVNTAVRGLITNIDVNAGQLIVLGTTILVDTDTITERLAGGAALQDFAVGDPVGVSGLETSGDQLLATRLEEVAPGGENLLVGEVTNLAATRFEINALVVDFGGAELVGFPGGTVAEDDDVRVTGTLFGAGGEFLAAKLEFLPPILGLAEELGEFEGLVSNFVSPTEFQVGGVPVVTNANTGFVGGGPGNLTNGVSVVVRGEFDTTGALVADEITIRGTRIEVFGQVEATSTSTITVVGIPLLVVAETELRDKTDANIEPFHISDIRAGDYIDARSPKDPPSTTPVVAARIEREDEDDEVELQGFVSAVGVQTIQVLGANVDITSETDFEDANEEEITAQAFFAVVTPGTFVKVEADDPSHGRISATEVELEIDD